MEAGDGEAVFSAKTRPGADCGADRELLISNLRVQLKKSTERITVPKYNVHSGPDGLKVHIKTRFALVNLIDREQEELWPKTRTIQEECEKTMTEVQRKGKSRWMTEETLKIGRCSCKGKVKADKTGLESRTQHFNGYYIEIKRTIIGLAKMFI